jgi:non-specific serine/threonine protein kinase
VTASGPLRFYLFGSFRIEGKKGAVHLPTHKAASLLAFLVLNPDEQSREKLAALFWGDSPGAQARGSLRTALNILRKQLGDQFLLITRESVQVNPDFPLWMDAREFQTRAARVLSEPPDNLDEFNPDLYAGDLLADFYDDWVLRERERYHAVYLATLLRLTEYFRAGSKYERAIETARRILVVDPANENAHQHLMFCYLMTGNRSAALQQYEECKRALQEELGVEPMPETTALYERIKQSPPERSSQAALISNLPSPLTSFIGREPEMAEIKDLLSRARLLTLKGAGGSGKTRLAIQTATDLIDQFEDGVWWVNLAPLMNQALVPQAAANALGLSDVSNQPILETLVYYVRPRHLLLVLDNCEHLGDACARLAETLLSACPHLVILATSRETLGIAGETAWQVPALALPDPRALPSVERMMEYDGIRLFVERASAAASGFRLTEKNLSAVLQICSRLDGIPLAIELAAACTKVLSAEQIMTRLEDRFRLLTAGSRTALARHQTLRATMDWSYGLLVEREQVLFRRASVFPCSFSLEAAEGICCGEDIHYDKVIDVLERLVDKSLVAVEPGAEAMRYRLPETVRQYGEEKLRASGEADRIFGRHLEFFSVFAVDAEEKLRGPEQQEWLERLEIEHDNLRTALRWSQIATGAEEAGLRLAGALWRFWDVRGYLSEGRQWLTAILSRPGGSAAPTLAKADALNTAGRLALFQGDWTSAREAYEASLAIWQKLGYESHPGLAMSLIGLGRVAFRVDDLSRARTYYEASLAMSRASGDEWKASAALMGLGLVVSTSGDYAQAVALNEESLAICRKLGDKIGIAASLKYLGDFTFRQGDFERAWTLNNESLAISRELGDKVGIAMSLNHLGDVKFRQGDFAHAKSLYEEALSIVRELGIKGSITMSLNDLGALALAEGYPDRALGFYKESMGLAQELRSTWDIGWCLEGIASVAAVKGKFPIAACIWGAVEQMFEHVGYRVRPYDREAHEREMKIAREQLDPDTFAAAWAQGCEMSVQAALACARQV